MKVNAYAKINVGLDVVRKMENGYHELNMIMAPINIYDTIDISFSPTMEVTSNLRFIPTDERNSVVKVINRLRDIYHFEDQFKIHMEKHVPTQAGLGGGSSDAAAVLQVLNAVLNLNMNEEEMLEFATGIGADVPFFLKRTCCYVEGIGEKLTPFKLNCPFYMLLVKPKMGVSTKLAFEMLDFETLEHPDILHIREALETNNYPLLLNSLGNSLEQTAVQLVPEIAKLKEDLVTFGFDAAVMSGSGSTVIAFTRDRMLLENGFQKFRQSYRFVKKTQIIEP